MLFPLFVIDTDTYVQVATLLVKMESDVKTAWQV